MTSDWRSEQSYHEHAWLGELLTAIANKCLLPLWHLCVRCWQRSSLTYGFSNSQTSTIQCSIPPRSKDKVNQPQWSSAGESRVSWDVEPPIPTCCAQKASIWSMQEVADLHLPAPSRPSGSESGSLIYGNLVRIRLDSTPSQLKQSKPFPRQTKA